ncbi:TIR domain-containing protein, partial [Acinetobacter lwoffii]|uniref:TIR domain-containing protein n=2 Tax=Acinetobacter lwoffii TaxID=28090 RepID=UPI002091049B
MKRQVFYSFHYDNDVMRVQQIRNIGALEGNTPVSANDWETLKRNGDTAIKNWIDNQLKYKNCLIVLIGSQTANRPWVKYEIQRAWELGKAVLGIHIHNRSLAKVNSRASNSPFQQLNSFLDQI